MTARLVLPGLAVALASLTLEAAWGDGFGRWDTSLQHCQLSWSSDDRQSVVNSTCLAMRLDQSIEGLLRVRFINAAGSSRLASEELSFVGLLHKQDTPMVCSQGSCTPTWPIHLTLQGVTTLRFDSRGLAEQLPKVHLAQGRCRLEPPRLSCEAMTGTGHRWRAMATLRSGGIGATSGRDR
ncbi:MAG: hypothetical protein FJ077_14840 [Cyanobacteria bacterium K_DeepCast_35m_m2_023]|nr:hypothetical protein [Cyanobacteria bacterium K_DeepCast_35m_m2_023]